MKALLVGGTGPTGVPIARGLVERGYELAIFHHGAHESPELPQCEHIHADPHFRHTIDDALAGRKFDLVIASYRRLRHVGEALAGRCAQFISVGGPLAYIEPPKSVTGPMFTGADRTALHLLALSQSAARRKSEQRKDGRQGLF